MNMLMYVESAERATATEALYYCLRALKQAGLPSGAKKNYFFDTSSSAPTPDSVALAGAILAGIEAAEGSDIDHVDQAAIAAYIKQVAQTVDALSRQIEGFSVDRGAELLARMRASSSQLQ